MKKFITVLTIFICVSSALSAEIKLSVGGGGLFDMSFGNNEVDFNTTSFGAFVFIDLKYIEADVYFSFDAFKSKGDANALDNLATNSLGFSVLGKFPLLDLKLITLFPLLGVSYKMALSAKEDGEDFSRDSSDFNQLGLLGGVGLDINLGKLFIRGEALFQMKLPNKFMDAVYGAKTAFDMGPHIKLGVGYRF